MVLLQSHEITPHSPRWPNNYGVWVDEFEAIGLGDMFDIVWDEATVQLDSGPEHTRSAFCLPRIRWDVQLFDGIWGMFGRLAGDSRRKWGRSREGMRRTREGRDLLQGQGVGF